MGHIRANRVELRENHGGGRGLIAHCLRLVGTSQADAEKREIGIAEARALFLPEPEGEEGDGSGHHREQQQPARLFHDFHQRRNGDSDGFFASQAAEYAKHSVDPRGMEWRKR